MNFRPSQGRRSEFLTRFSFKILKGRSELNSLRVLPAEEQGQGSQRRAGAIVRILGGWGFHSDVLTRTINDLPFAHAIAFGHTRHVRLALRFGPQEEKLSGARSGI